jgi:hypothetical protein
MTYNVTLRGVRVTIMALEMQSELNTKKVCLYSFLSYPACNSHSPHYIFICGLSVSAKFSILFQKRHDFLKKKIVNIEGVLIFITTFI